MAGYSQYVAWSSEDSQFVAVSPEFGHLIALGDTEEAAVTGLKTAIELVLGSMSEVGESPPGRIEYASHSGQFRVRLPRSLHAQLAMRATIEGVSLNTLVCTLLSDGLARRACSMPPVES